MDGTVAIARALGDANRLRLVMALRGGELCVCQLVELAGLATSTVSAHLAVLRRAGLVAARKRERWVYYRLPGRGAAAPVRRALGWITAALEAEPAIAADSRRLATLRTCNPETLCRRQSRRRARG